MTDDDFEPVLREFLAERFGAGEVASDAPLFDLGILDSMNVLEVAVFLEKRFGIRVAPYDLVPGNFQSLARLSDYLAKKRYSGPG